MSLFVSSGGSDLIVSDSTAAFRLWHSLTNPHKLEFGAASTGGGFDGSGPVGSVAFTPNGSEVQAELALTGNNARAVLQSVGSVANPRIVLADTNVFGTLHYGSNQAGGAFELAARPSGGGAAPPKFNFTCYGHASGFTGADASMWVALNSLADSSGNSQSSLSFTVAQGDTWNGTLAGVPADKRLGQIMVLPYATNSVAQTESGSLSFWSAEQMANTGVSPLEDNSSLGTNLWVELCRTGEGLYTRHTIFHHGGNVGIGEFGGDVTPDFNGAHRFLVIQENDGLPSASISGAAMLGVNGGTLVLRNDGDSGIAAVVSQSGSVTAGNLAIWDSNGRIKDGGSIPTNLAARAGSFDVWQRGTSVSVTASTTAYANDGWYLIAGANQASTVARSTGIATGSQYAAKVQRNNAQTGTAAMRYAMPLDSDEIAKFAGQYVALSFTIKAGANFSPTSGVMGVLFICGTGAPAKRGSSAYTSETQVISQAPSITTTATRYTYTSAAVVPANATQAEIQFYWTPTGTAGADDSFTIDDLQLEVVSSSSDTASSFVPAPFALQLQMCQRYFQSTYPYGTAPGTADTGGGINLVATGANRLMGLMLQSRMRSTSPTITLWDPSASSTTNAVRNLSDGQVTLSGVSFNGARDQFAWRILSTSGTPFTAGNDYNFHYTADASL